MYYNIVNNGFNEIFKTLYKVQPVRVVNGEFDCPEEHPLKMYSFEKYEDCFLFFKDYFEETDRFFDPDGPFKWNREPFDGFDHFDILHVVTKVEDGSVVTSEVVASVKASDEYPFNVEEPTTENVEESVPEVVDDSDQEYCPECEIEKLNEKIRLLQEMVVHPETKDDIIKMLGYDEGQK